MTAQKEQRSFSNFGFSTILLSFVMICVVIFSALTLITANSDYKLSKRVADKTSAYYIAQEKAYERLIAIEELCVNCYTSSIGAESFFGRIEAHGKTYGSIQTIDGILYLMFEEPIAENQHLSVKLRISYPETENTAFFEIVEWKSIYNIEIPEDSFLDLIQ